MDQEFGQGIMGMACLCSIMSKASVGKICWLVVTDSWELESPGDVTHTG